VPTTDLCVLFFTNDRERVLAIPLNSTHVLSLPPPPLRHDCDESRMPRTCQGGTKDTAMPTMLPEMSATVAIDQSPVIEAEVEDLEYQYGGDELMIGAEDCVGELANSTPMWEPALGLFTSDRCRKLWTSLTKGVPSIKHRKEIWAVVQQMSDRPMPSYRDVQKRLEEQLPNPVRCVLLNAFSLSLCPLLCLFVCLSPLAPMITSAHVLPAVEVVQSQCVRLLCASDAQRGSRRD